jgi:import receptor subunit TOM70
MTRSKLTCRRPRNPLPIVNKALVMVQWKQDSAEAEKLLMQALELDPDCDTAIITMAQLTLQKGDPEGAIKWFERSGKLARTQLELENALTCRFARAGSERMDADAQSSMLRGHRWRSRRSTPSTRTTYWLRWPRACKVDDGNTRVGRETGGPTGERGRSADDQSRILAYNLQSLLSTTCAPGERERGTSDVRRWIRMHHFWRVTWNRVMAMPS